LESTDAAAPTLLRSVELFQPVGGLLPKATLAQLPNLLWRRTLRTQLFSSFGLP
jgi:hypothetical protein